MRFRKFLATILKRILPRILVLRIRWLEDSIRTEFNYRFNHDVYKHGLAQIAHTPVVLDIEATNICNAACVFCAYPQMERQKTTMTMELFCRVVTDYLDMGGHRIDLTPVVGDCFVDRHLQERLTWLFHEPRVHEILIITNAIKMSDARCEQLLAFGEKVKLNISWGGFDSESYKTYMGVGRFDQVNRNVTNLVEKKIATGSPLDVMVSIRSPSDVNRGPVYEKLRKWKERGIIKFGGECLSYGNWVGKIAPETLRAVNLIPTLAPNKKGPCSWLVTQPVVLADGRVNACSCMDVEAQLTIGDVNQNSLQHIWFGGKHREFISEHELGNYPEVCQRCNFYSSVYNSHRAMYSGRLWRSKSPADENTRPDEALLPIVD